MSMSMKRYLNPKMSENSANKVGKIENFMWTYDVYHVNLT